MQQYIVRLSQDDPEVDFRALQSAGIVGVVLKSSRGSSEIDPTFHERYTEAKAIFGRAVGSYHDLDDSDPHEQIQHYLQVTAGMPGRWLCYEACSLETALKASRSLQVKQAKWPGIFGGELLSQAMGEGHFGPSPIWISSIGAVRPRRVCQLWEFEKREDNGTFVAGCHYNLSQFMGVGDARVWMASL